MSNKPKQLTTNQKIAIWGIIVPAVISLGIASLQNKIFERRIGPIIEMKPQIVNVISNVTKVEKEIANLHEILKQQYSLWENETFRKSDLDIVVKKINRPSSAKETTASFLVFELKKIPLQNSLVVSNEKGVVPSNTLEILQNIVRLRYFGNTDKELNKETDFFNIMYLPDVGNSGKSFTIKGMTYKYQWCNDDTRKCEVDFHFEPREN